MTTTQQDKLTAIQNLQSTMENIKLEAEQEIKALRDEQIRIQAEVENEKVVEYNTTFYGYNGKEQVAKVSGRMEKGWVHHAAKNPKDYMSKEMQVESTLSFMVIETQPIAG